MAIVSLSGKINSGKDTVGEIIQIITNSPHFTNEAVLSFIGKPHLSPKWKIKKFADNLKDIVCMLLGCTREQLEDREFKEKELGKEWGRIITSDGNIHLPDDYPNLKYSKLTPRLLLQLLGTECGRQIIHPQIWVNALMSEYKLINGNISSSPYSSNRMNNALAALKSTYPNWIITDTRFENELKAVENRQGITIRVNRISSCECGNSTDWIYSTIKDGSNRYCRKCNQKQTIKNEHESETSLDSAIFDYTIDNDGTLLELVGKVREILILEKII